MFPAMRRAQAQITLFVDRLGQLPAFLRLAAMRGRFRSGGYPDDRAALDMRRVEYVRWLVAHKRISEFPHAD